MPLKNAILSAHNRNRRFWYLPRGMFRSVLISTRNGKNIKKKKDYFGGLSKKRDRLYF